MLGFLNFLLVRSAIDKMENKEKLVQFTLTGQKANNNIIVQCNSLRLKFAKKDSIWQTLAFFYDANYSKLKFLSFDDLELIHSQMGPFRKTKNGEFPIHAMSIRNNIRRLLKHALIFQIPSKFGLTGRQKKYQITPNGIKLLEQKIKNENV
jgi:hypothetical protein